MRNVFLLLLAMNLWSASNFPTLFSQMGDPLYSYAQKSVILENDPLLGTPTTSFIERADAVWQTGLSAEGSKNKMRHSEYLKQLRGLQQAYDRLMGLMKREMVSAVTAGDTPRLIELAAAEPAVALQDRALRQTLAEYYKANALQGRSAFLDKVAREDSDVETIYSEGVETVYAESAFQPASAFKPAAVRPKKPEVIVLGTAHCPYCIKARKFLRAQKIPFRDYDVDSSKMAQRLYKKHHGNGVPLILVGDVDITGFNPEAILRAYNR